jgi:hypothetical protein
VLTLASFRLCQLHYYSESGHQWSDGGLWRWWHPDAGLLLPPAPGDLAEDSTGNTVPYLIIETASVSDTDPHGSAFGTWVMDLDPDLTKGYGNICSFFNCDLTIIFILTNFDVS